MCCCRGILLRPVAHIVIIGIGYLRSTYLEVSEAERVRFQGELQAGEVERPTLRSAQHLYGIIIAETKDTGIREPKGCYQQLGANPKLQCLLFFKSQVLMSSRDHGGFLCGGYVMQYLLKGGVAALRLLCLTGRCRHSVP